MSQISPFSQISMLPEDKELKKSIPLQINRGRERAFAERNQKNKFKKSWNLSSSKAITRSCGSNITLRNETFGLHFQISDPTFFHFTLILWRGPKVLFATLHHISCVCIITGKLTGKNHLRILQLIWTFLMPMTSRCKSYFSGIFTYIFYLFTTHNRVKQLYFCMIGSFVISNKVVWRFNGETFVKQSVKLVPSVDLLFLKFCYQKSGH